MDREGFKNPEATSLSENHLQRPKIISAFRVEYLLRSARFLAAPRSHQLRCAGIRVQRCRWRRPARSTLLTQLLVAHRLRLAAILVLDTH